jgi:hypothetical protein
MRILPQSAVVAWAVLGCLASPSNGASIELTYIRQFLDAPTNAPVDHVVSSNGSPGQFLVPTVSSRSFYSVPPYFSDTRMSYSLTSFVSNAEIKVEGMNAVEASFAARKDPEGIGGAYGYSRCDLVYSFAVTNPVEYNLTVTVDAEECFSFGTDSLRVNLWPYVWLDFTSPTSRTVVFVGTDAGSAACLESTNNLQLRGILPVGQSTLTLVSEAYARLSCLDQCSYAAPLSVCHFNLCFRAWDIPGAPVVQFDRRGDELVLWWPVSATNFVLESTVTLGASSVWLEVTNTPVTVGDRFQVISGTTNSLSFYRLRNVF